MSEVIELPEIIKRADEIAVLNAVEEIFKETPVTLACVVSDTAPTFFTLFATYV